MLQRNQAEIPGSNRLNSFRVLFSSQSLNFFLPSFHFFPSFHLFSLFFFNFRALIFLLNTYTPKSLILLIGVSFSKSPVLWVHRHFLLLFIHQSIPVRWQKARDLPHLLFWTGSKPLSAASECRAPETIECHFLSLVTCGNSLFTRTERELKRK